MSKPATASESLQTWLLKQRHEDLTKIFCTAWDLYVKFYTVFLTFSLGAMGWILTRSGNDKLPKNVVHIIAWAFVVQSLLTGATSAFMADYSHRVANDHVSFRERHDGSGN